MTIEKLRSLPDDDLLARLSTLLKRSRRVEAELVAHIGEVDARRLYAREGSSSMFAYATDVLHLSEHQAYERITAARAARRFPQLLEMLEDGRLHLSGLSKLVPHLTEENCEQFLAQAAHKTKKRIEELVAELAPRPDVAPVIRKLPERKPPGRGAASRPAETPSNSCRQELAAPAAPAPAPAPPPRRVVVEPLAPARYKVQFTASASLRDKLERLRELTGEDLAEAIEAAVTERVERLEARKYGATKRPRKALADTDTWPSSRRVPAAVRRAVRERDSGHCRFVSANGKRCNERRGLELHHHDPYGRGGAHDPETISLMCRAHNAYLAEREYGREAMERYRRPRDGVREPRARYGDSRTGPVVDRSQPRARRLSCRSWSRVASGSGPLSGR